MYAGLSCFENAIVHRPVRQGGDPPRAQLEIHLPSGPEGAANRGSGNLADFATQIPHIAGETSRQKPRAVGRCIEVPTRDRGCPAVPPTVLDPGLQADLVRARTGPDGRLPHPVFSVLAARQAHSGTNAAGAMPARRKPRAADAFIPGIATLSKRGRETFPQPLFHSRLFQRAPIANDFGSTVSGSVIGGRASPAAPDGLDVHPLDGAAPPPTSGIAFPARNFQQLPPFVGCLLHFQKAVHHIRRRSGIPPVCSDFIPGRSPASSAAYPGGRSPGPRPTAARHPRHGGGRPRCAGQVTSRPAAMPAHRSCPPNRRGCRPVASRRCGPTRN